MADTLKWYVIEEMKKHKWIASKQAGRDLGRAAIDEWERRFGWLFCRIRRFEHIHGREVVRVYDNLEVINWADSDPEISREFEHVLLFLELININAARLEFPASWKDLALAA
jgi:hypothetical protein